MVDASTVHAGYLLVVRAEVLEPEGVPPLVGARVRSAEGLRYRGADRQPVGATFVPGGVREVLDDLDRQGIRRDGLLTGPHAVAGLERLARAVEAWRPARYEPVYLSESDGSEPDVRAFRRAGWEPGFFTHPHHAPLAEWLRTGRLLRHHMNDPRAREFLDRLDDDGLFATPDEARAFLAHRLATDGQADRGAYRIHRVWVAVRDPGSAA